MKLCRSHIDRLTEMLISKGLARFISYDVGEATRRAQMWLTGTMQNPLKDFDARAICCLEINRAARKYGINLPDGQCPLCAAPIMLATKRADDWWMENATDAVKLFALTHDLLPRHRATSTVTYGGDAQPKEPAIDMSEVKVTPPIGPMPEMPPPSTLQ